MWKMWIFNGPTSSPQKRFPKWAADGWSLFLEGVAKVTAGFGEKKFTLQRTPKTNLWKKRSTKPQKMPEKTWCDKCEIQSPRLDHSNPNLFPFHLSFPEKSELDECRCCIRSTDSYCWSYSAIHQRVITTYIKVLTYFHDSRSPSQVL